MKGEYLAAINMLSNEKGVSPEIVVEALESALVAAYKRGMPETGLNVRAEIDPATGGARLFAEKTVVEDPGELWEIGLEAAQIIQPTASLGDVLWQDVTPKAFGRIDAQSAKQAIIQKLREAERKRVYDEFSGRVGEILHGLVQRIEQRTVILDLGRAEAVMPPAEQVIAERYYPGQRLRVYLVDVQEGHKGPQLLVSRSHKLIIKRLFEQEVPEIFNGTVEIKAIAREPGARSKVAVCAHQEGLDPVGSCVGMRGVRIQNIVNELGGEKIDVIPWDPDPAAFVAAALAPAQVQRVDISEDEKTATVIVPERQLSLAIGREGQNARLAARLSGWRIDIKSDAAIARSEMETQTKGDEPTSGESLEAPSAELVSAEEPLAHQAVALDPPSAELVSAEEPLAHQAAALDPPSAELVSAEEPLADQAVAVEPPSAPEQDVVVGDPIPKLAKARKPRGSE